MNIKQEDFRLKALVNDTCQGHFAMMRCLADGLLSRLGVRGTLFWKSWGEVHSFLLWGYEVVKKNGTLSFLRSGTVEVGRRRKGGMVLKCWDSINIDCIEYRDAYSSNLHKRVGSSRQYHFLRMLISANLHQAIPARDKAHSVCKANFQLIWS